jgi:hypothetical protein
LKKKDESEHLASENYHNFAKVLRRPTSTNQVK